VDSTGKAYKPFVLPQEDPEQPDREGSIIGYREKQVFTVGRYLGMAGGAIMLLGIPYGLDPLAPFFGIFMERYAAKDELETFPTFSPDGNWIYYCSAPLLPLPDSIHSLKCDELFLSEIGDH